MKAVVNGRDMELGKLATLIDLIDTFNVKAESLIVSLNDRVVSREQWPELIISEGDHIELVSLVGGG
jgi:sulfur carrier protein